MKYKNWKKAAALLLAAAVLAVNSLSAYAGGNTREEGKGKGSVSDAEITVGKDDKPFLSFGADLRRDEKTKVLDLLGVDEADLDQYDVIEVTNEQEHKYLDKYISAGKIGNRALSSVVVMEGKRGSGINVTTKNINYCTTGMYENALVTAGLTDAEVLVAGPFEISGTAALIGAVEAYAVMSGEEISEENIDAAVNEIVTTGNLETETGSTDEIEGMVAYLKGQVAGKDLSSDEIQGEIAEAAKKFHITLTETQRDDLTKLMTKIQGLDLNMDSLKNQAQSVYDKLKDIGANVDVDALTEQAQGFFEKIIAFFKKLFGKL